MKAYWGVEVTPRERGSGIHLIGGRVGPRTGLDVVVRRKSSQPLRGLEPPIIQPVALVLYH
jgi:hypothetical protein